ncbi:aspartate kinase [Vicingaceae bacterium]|nr:aspartate kinase [Vicingaceae bacterium]MDB4060760.1 aspartate kinase [Vicingaceae bacterium]
MKVLKFGGASVKDTEGVKNAANIIKSQSGEKLVVVVSAMGKTTNAFEGVLESHLNRSDEVFNQLEAIKSFHFEVCNELFENKQNPIFQELHNTFVEAEWQIEDEPIGNRGFEYDQLIGLGELFSTKILTAYLKLIGIENAWVDARDIVRTDNTYQAAKIDWEETERLIQQKLATIAQDIIVTQGFIGSSSENFTTTLGREGSDFSAAIFASSLNAKEVVIWKDVEGMLNADPKYYGSTVKLENISYKEAIELAYYGASVIHPKTVKPLENKKIPLYVKSFKNPSTSGSLIDGNSSKDCDIPSYIHKENQILVSFSSKEFDFIDELRLSEIFQLFSDIGLSVNILQNSAISFTVAFDFDKAKIEELRKAVSDKFRVVYNEGATLITIRHFTEQIIADLLKGRTVLLEQRTRSTARFVLT